MFNMLGDPGYTQQALNIVKTHRKKTFLCKYCRLSKYNILIFTKNNSNISGNISIQ